LKNSKSDGLFDKIAIYPNPASSEFKVRLQAPAKSEGSLQVFDLTGRLRRTGIIQRDSQWITIDAADLLPGIYFVSINDGERRYNEKIVVQH